MIGRAPIVAAALVAVPVFALTGTVSSPARTGPGRVQPTASSAAKAATPMIHAPASARLGGRVTVTTTGLVRGRYALTLVSDQQPARHAFCLARLGTAVRASTHPAFSATIPHRLRCYQGVATFLERVPARPGAYHFVVGVPIAPAASDGDHSLVRAAVRISL